MMYAKTIKNLKKTYSSWFQYFLTATARMNSDSGDAAEYLAKVTDMNCPDIMC
jgi:hypothetical protein